MSFKAFALTGRQVCEHDNPGRCPGLRASAPSGRAASMSFCPLPMLSTGDRWLRACCFYELLSFTYVSAGDLWFRAYCFYELSPFTFALPFGQLFSIPLRAGDRWLRACRVISTVQVILFSVSYEIVLSLADKSIFRDTECTFQITEWRFRTTECTFRVTERNFL